MQFYQEVTLLPDAEVSLGFLWQRVYQQVHIALVENKVADNQSEVGISFPEYGSKSFPLGRKLRLFATTQQALEALRLADFLSRLTDYVHFKSVQPVPEVDRYACFLRHRVKGSARIERDQKNKALLRAQQSGQSYEDCLIQLSKTKPKAESKLPFIWLESMQTKKQNPDYARKFPLFIRKLEQEGTQAGFLNCYGLSHPDHLVALPDF